MPMDGGRTPHGRIGELVVDLDMEGVSLVRNDGRTVELPAILLLRVIRAAVGLNLPVHENGGAGKAILRNHPGQRILSSKELACMTYW